MSPSDSNTPASDSPSTDTTTTATDGGPVVEVKLRVFIPCRALTTPSLSGRRAFAGDNRDFSYADGTSRAELVGSVKVGVPGSGGTTTLVSRQFGRSEEYKVDDVIAVAGKPDWFLDLKPGYTVLDSATLDATDDTLNIVAGSASSTTEAGVSIAELTTLSCMSVTGALPLMTGAPSIDATLYTHFRVDGGRLQGKVHGTHDGFPAYEIYFNQQLAYSFDPVAAGTTPMNLMPPEDITADTAYLDLGPA